MGRFAERVLDGWCWVLLLIGAGIIAAVLNRWQPWEVVGLVAALGGAGAALAAVGMWCAVRVRAIELAAITTDEQAARLLGEALRRCGPFLSEQVARELWDTFVALPGETKRTMALAIVGFVGDSGASELIGAANTLVTIARSFRAPVEAP
jgi:hypothetical protein